jgi:tRNA modification GTPase
MMGDTIFALSSGSVPAGVAVIRVAGPGVRFGLDTILGMEPEPRRMVVADIHDRSGNILDRGMAVFFPAPHSFSGDDTMELHVHGGPAVVASVLASLGELRGYRLAEAGEFTRRAFNNGKLDLLQVEGLADLIGAETVAQQLQALRQSGGAVSQIYGRWRTEIVRARAMIEAELDFADEEDVPDTASDPIWDGLARLRQEIINHVGDRRGERLRHGIEIVIAGAPNSGKSSLVNALAKRDVAIVAAEAGTTRDLIEVRLDLDGVAVTLVDTAGLRTDTGGGVEEEGIRRARSRAKNADLVLWLDDLSGNGGEPESMAPGAAMVIGTKSDLIDSQAKGSATRLDYDAIVSVVSGDGIAEFLELLADRARVLAGSGGSALVTRERHRQALRLCETEIGLAVEGDDTALEIRAEALRRAGDALGRITGAVGVEDLLDVVFSDFCVGK